MVWKSLLLKSAQLQLDSQCVSVGCNTLNHMLAHGSLTLKQRLPCHSGRTFSSLYIRRILHIQWEYGGIFTQGDLSLLLYIMAEVLRCWQVGLWIMWLPERIVIQWSSFVFCRQALWLYSPFQTWNTQHFRLHLSKYGLFRHRCLLHQCLLRLHLDITDINGKSHVPAWYLAPGAVSQQ